MSSTTRSTLRAGRLACLALAAVLAGGCAADREEPKRTGAATVSAAPEPAQANGSSRQQPQARVARVEDPALARWSGPGFSIATVRRGRSVLMRRSPGGSVLARLGPRTEFKSPRSFGVVARRGRWLGVSAPELRNGRLGWVDGRSLALRPSYTTLSLRADLSRRSVELRSGKRTLRRFRVAIGRPDNPTPSGRFAVTDVIDARPYGGTYGCCIVALSGHQPRLPPGWPGGDRLALHGTRASGSVGRAASTGCLRARDANLRTVIARLPLGAPVFIRA